MTIYLGGDVSKGYADFCFIGPEGELLHQCRLDDTADGHEQLEDLVEEFAEPDHEEEISIEAAVEATGGLERNWLQRLRILGERFDLQAYQVNPYVLRQFTKAQLHANKTDEETLDLDTYEITETAHILTDQDRIHALTAWRAYNQGARIEARIKELRQLAVGQTAIDDRAGNALLWNLGTLAYQLLHILRQRALTGAWKVASPDRIRQWLIRMPAKYTRHARKRYLQLRRDEPLRLRFLKALRRLASWDPPPLAACS